MFAIGIVLIGAFSSASTARHSVHESPTKTSLTAAKVKLPLGFEANQGQSDPQVRYLARTSDSTVFVTPSEAVFAYRDGATLRMHVVGGAASDVVADHPKPGVSNYYIGKDRSSWISGIPTFGEVVAHDVTPGLDVHYKGAGSQLEYDLAVAPGADPSGVGLTFEGANGVHLDNGDLVLTLPGGEVRHGKPTIYQDLPSGRHNVSGSYLLRGNAVGFAVGAYDHTRPLVIDPVVYSNYEGGSSFDQALSVGVDAAGNAYITGNDQTGDFPSVPPGQTPSTAYVAKLDPTGTTLLYSTFFGGPDTSHHQTGMGIAVDGPGNAYVNGFYQNTDSTPNDLPVTPGAYDSTPRTFTDATTTLNSTTITTATPEFSQSDALRVITGPSILSGEFIVSVNSPTSIDIADPATGSATSSSITLDAGHLGDAWVGKFTPSGGIAAATYLGPTATTGGGGTAIALDPSSNVYAALNTGGWGFPAVNGFQSETLNQSDGKHATLAKLNSALSSLLYSTSITGSSNQDVAEGVAVDATGRAVVSGTTHSSNFPTTTGAYQTTLQGSSDVFLTEIDTTASGSASLLWSTYLGGSGDDGGSNRQERVALDSTGHPYVTGITKSSDFPTTTGAFQTSAPGGGSDLFVTKLTSDGQGLVYSTYLGGSGAEAPLGNMGIAVDGGGNAYVSGQTKSSDFPTASPIDGKLRGTSDMTVTKLNAAGNGLVWSTYLGGTEIVASGVNEGQDSSVTLDGSGSAYVAGNAAAPDWPSAPGASPPVPLGKDDAVVTKLTTGHRQRLADFDANGTTDISLFRPSVGAWYVTGDPSSPQFFGLPGDLPVSADYNGDGSSDRAVFRPSTGAWYVQGDGGSPHFFGLPGDKPVPGDYNGDGKAERAVYRNGAWFIDGGGPAQYFGLPSDFPIPADYDGDGRVDLAVYRPSAGQWFIRPSSGGPDVTVSFGLNGDVPVAGDYNGDGAADIAVYRPSVGAWFIDDGGPTTTFFGLSGDIPVPGDYNRDGIDDLAVYRPSVGAWFIAGDGGSPHYFGLSSDIPAPRPG